MAIAKVTLIGLLNWDSGLFDPLTLPDGINKELFKNTLLLRGGEFPVIYPNADFMKIAIKAWGDKMNATFTRWVQTLTEDYNPLHNYDRYEDWTDDEKNKASNTTKTQLETGSNTTTETDVTGYDSDTYQPNHKVTETGTGNQEGESNGESSGERSGTHKGHLYGNIGVTTSAEMASQEIDLRAAYNLYDLMTEAFIHEFCIEVY